MSVMYLWEAACTFFSMMDIDENGSPKLHIVLAMVIDCLA